MVFVAKIPRNGTTWEVCSHTVCGWVVGGEWVRSPKLEAGPAEA